MKSICGEKLVVDALSFDDSQNSALDETFVEDYHEEIPSTPSSTSIKSEPNTPLTVDRFTRKILDETFGKGTSAKNFTKQGSKTSDPVVSSPAVKSDLVKVCNDGTVDQRSAAVKQGLVVVDNDGGVIKKESLLCQKQIVFTPTGNISKTSPAVESGLLLLKKNGEVDKRSSAVKKGWVKFDDSGAVDLKNSLLFQPQQLHLKETNGAHIFGFEVADKLTQLGDLQYTKEEATRMIQAINTDGNVRIKTRGGNMSESITGAKGSGDLALDKIILAAMDDANPTVQLKECEAKRASKVINEILSGDYPIELKVEARQVFTKMRDENGHKIIRSNAKLTTPEGTEEYHVSHKTSTVSEASPSLSGKNLSSDFDNAAKTASSAPTLTQRERVIEQEKEREKAVERQKECARVEEKERAAEQTRRDEMLQLKERERAAESARVEEKERAAEQTRRDEMLQLKERERAAECVRVKEKERVAEQARRDQQLLQQRERERAAEQQKERERAAERQRERERAEERERVAEQQRRDQLQQQRQREAEQQRRDQLLREQQVREQAAEQQRNSRLLQQRQQQQQVSYGCGGSSSSSSSGYGGNGGYGGYSTQSSGASHSGRRCNDGSLDMRCSENRGFSKWG